MGMLDRELTYEIDTPRPALAESYGYRIAELEGELRRVNRQLEIARIERDLARLRIKQFERLVGGFAGTIDQLQTEIESLLRPRERRHNFQS